MNYLVIDGYNVINSWKGMFDLILEPLEDCREKLIDIMINFKGCTDYEVIIVFDAYKTKAKKDNIQKINNLKVVFTKENKTADNYIERFVYKNSKENTITVVTSDFLEQRIILANGGLRMPPSELLASVNATNKKCRSNARSEVRKTNTIMSNLDEEIVEKLDKMRRGEEF